MFQYVSILSTINKKHGFIICPHWNGNCGASAGHLTIRAVEGHFEDAPGACEISQLHRVNFLGAAFGWSHKVVFFRDFCSVTYDYDWGGCFCFPREHAQVGQQQWKLMTGRWFFHILSHANFHNLRSNRFLIQHDKPEKTILDDWPDKHEGSWLLGAMFPYRNVSGIWDSYSNPTPDAHPHIMPVANGAAAVEPLQWESAA